MWVFCLLVLLAFSSCLYHVRADQATKNKNLVIEYCKKHIIKYLGDACPKHNSKCCRMVGLLIDIRAICQKFTIKDVIWIDLAKWATVTHVCGNPLLPGTKCAGVLICFYIFQHLDIISLLMFMELIIYEELNLVCRLRCSPLWSRATSI